MSLEEDLKRIEKLLEKIKLGKAEKELKKLIKKYGHKREIIDPLARLLIVRGKKEEAVRIIEEAIKENPKDIGMKIFKAEILGIIGREEEARRILEKLKEEAKGDERAEIICELAFYVKKENPEKALEMVEEELKKNPENPDLLMRKAEILADLGRLEEAEEIGRKLLEKKDPYAYYILALVNWQKNNITEARKYAEKAVKYFPENPGILYLYADILRLYDEFEKALKYVEKALEIKPNYIKALELKAILLTVMLKGKEALKTIEKAIKLNPNSADLWSHKGIILELLLGKPEEALKCYEKALELDSHDWSNYGMLANFYARRGNIVKAQEYFKKMIELGDPEDPDFWLSKGDLLVLLGRRGEALEAYREGLRRFPNNPSYKRLFEKEIKKLLSS